MPGSQAPARPASQALMSEANPYRGGRTYTEGIDEACWSQVSCQAVLSSEFAPSTPVQGGTLDPLALHPNKNRQHDIQTSARVRAASTLRVEPNPVLVELPFTALPIVTKWLFKSFAWTQHVVNRRSPFPVDIPQKQILQ